jgi:exodeoxyribonuclease-3
MKILSLNIVSFRSFIKKNNIIDNKKSKNNTFENYLSENNFDIVCLQELKLNEDSAHILLDFMPEKYEYKYLNIPHIKKGYSGVGIMSKIKPIKVSDKLLNSDSENESEGRYMKVEYKDFYLINVYFPNAGEGLKRLKYKDNFNKIFLKKILKLKSKKEVIIIGDFNAIQSKIDTYSFDSHYNKLAGVTDLEIKFLNELIDSGFKNTFRELHPNKIQYSYFTYRWSGRSKNLGLLIDFALITEKLLKKVKSIKYLDNIYGSDHLPIQLHLDI